MSDYGNPGDLPGYDAAGEEWYASGAPEVVRFETAAAPQSAPVGVKVFVGVVLGIVGLIVVSFVVSLIITAVGG